MPPETTETKKENIFNLWTVTIIVIALLIVFVALLSYFISKDKKEESFLDYSDVEMQRFLETTGVSDTPIYSDEELEAFSKTTKTSDSSLRDGEEMQRFLETTKTAK